MNLTKLATFSALLVVSTSLPAHVSHAMQGPSNKSRIGNVLGRISAKIIGGDVVQQEDEIASTTVAILKRSFFGASLCTGTLIAKDLVLTAAHCVGKDTQDLRIIFRRNLREDDGDAVTPFGVSRHEGYLDYEEEFESPEGGGEEGGKALEKELEKDLNDIALLSFKGGLPAGYTVATLLEDSALLQEGGTVTLAGYGITSGDPEDDSKGEDGILRKTDVTIQRALFGSTETLLDQSQGHGACHGDSGGPGFVRGPDGRYFVFGVTSRGPENQPDNCATQSIYTNVPAHMAFIQKASLNLQSELQTDLGLAVASLN